MLFEPFLNCLIELFKGVEHLIPKRCEDPLVNQLHCILDMGFIFWLSLSCREDRCSVVLGKVGEQRIKVRLINTCLQHPGFQVVRDDGRRDPSEKPQGSFIGANKALSWFWFST